MIMSELIYVYFIKNLRQIKNNHGYITFCSIYFIRNGKSAFLLATKFEIIRGVMVPDFLVRDSATAKPSRFQDTKEV